MAPKTGSGLDRIKDLEAQMEADQKTIAKLSSRLGEQDLILNAIASVVGEEEVQAEINRRIAQQEAQKAKVLEATVNHVTSAAAQGQPGMVDDAIINPTSAVVYTLVTHGEVQPPGYVMLPAWKDLFPFLQSRLLGAKVGTEIDTESDDVLKMAASMDAASLDANPELKRKVGTKLRVLRILKPVEADPVKQAEYAQVQALKAAEAAKAKAAEDEKALATPPTESPAPDAA